MITIKFQFPGVTALQYDEACRLANVSQSNLPDGLVFHCASLTDGGLMVVDVWESEEQFRTFGERLMPAIQQLGIEGHPQIFRTHAIMGPGVAVHA